MRFGRVEKAYGYEGALWAWGAGIATFLFLPVVWAAANAIMGAHTSALGELFFRPSSDARPVILTLTALAVGNMARLFHAWRAIERERLILQQVQGVTGIAPSEERLAEALKNVSARACHHARGSGGL